MADPIDYDRLAEVIANALDRRGTAEALDKETEAIEDATKEKLKFIKTMRESSGVTATFSRILTGRTEDLSATIEKNRKVMDDLAEKYRKATRDEDRRNIKEEIRETRRAAAYQNLSVALSNASLGAIKFTATLLDAVGSAGAQFVRSLQTSGNGIQMSAGIMNAGVDLANSAAQGLAGATTAAGAGLMAILKGPFKLLGAAVAGLGTAFGFLAERTAKVVKFGIEILSTELEKTIKAFRATNSAGALFADGLTGMRQAARAAGLTVAQFAQVLSQHSDDLADLGLGVSGGARKMGSVLTTGGEKMKLQLLNLGYGFEEQAGLVAETMSMMRGLGGPLSASNTEIVQQTTKYAESLRLIAGITGEDAKKKMEQARQQSRVLAFQQWLAGKDANQRQNIIAAMATMTEGEKKNFMDRAVLGTVINKEGAIYESTVRGARAKGEEQFRLAQAGELTAQVNARLNAEYGHQIKESTLANKSIGIAGYVLGGVMGNVAAAMLESAEQANKYMTDAVTAVATALTGQKDTNNALTTSLNNATIAAQNMAKKLEEMLDPLIAIYAKVSEKMLTEISATFDRIRTELSAWAEGKESSTKTSEKLEEFKARAAEKGATAESIGSKVKYAGAGIAGLGAIAAIAGAVMSMTGVGAAAGVPMMAAGGKMLLGGAKVGLAGWGIEEAGALAKDQAKQQNGLIDRIGKMLGYRQGGVSRGPSSGYLQKLHGTEAIVPLPDGKTIPVQIDVDSIMRDSGIDLGSDSATLEGFKDSIDYGKNTFITTFDYINSGVRSAQSMMSDYIDDVLAQLATDSTKTVTTVIDNFGLTSRSVMRQLGRAATEEKQPAAPLGTETVKTFKIGTDDAAGTESALANLARININLVEKVSGTESALGNLARENVNLAEKAVGTESSLAGLARTNTNLTEKVSELSDAISENRVTRPFNQDISSLVDNLKDNINIKVSSANEEQKQVSKIALDQDSLSQLKLALVSNNKEVQELLSTQNSLLEKNVDSMGRLADIMTNNYTINSRLYREMT